MIVTRKMWGHETDLEQEWTTPYIVELQYICVYIYILIYMCDPCGLFPVKLPPCNNAIK